MLVQAEELGAAQAHAWGLEALAGEFAHAIGQGGIGAGAVQGAGQGVAAGGGEAGGLAECGLGVGAGE